MSNVLENKKNSVKKAIVSIEHLNRSVNPVTALHVHFDEIKTFHTT